MPSRQFSWFSLLRRPSPKEAILSVILTAAVSAVAVYGGCGDSRDNGSGGNPDDPNAPVLVGLDIKPNNDVLLVDLNTEATKDFTVRGYFSDGKSADYTRKVTWALDNGQVGKFIGPKFHSATLGSNKVDFTRITAKRMEGGKLITAVANLTLVWLRQSGDSQDFFFSLPYKAMSQKKNLTFSTQVQSLDVFFDVDTTGSMSGEINELSNSLQNKIIPGVKAAAAKDAWFGIGAQDDWPNGINGTPNCHPGLADDQPLVLIQPMTASVADAQKGAAALLVGGGTRGCGADLPEGHLESYYQVATGEGNQVPGIIDVPPHKKGIGGVEFRDGALPVLVGISDAVFHTKNEPAGNCFGPTDYQGATAMAAHDRKQVTDALNKICAKYVGISAIIGQTENCLATKDMTYFANATGAVIFPEAWDVPKRPDNCGVGKCCTGQNGAAEDPDMNGLCPLVFKTTGQGTGLGDQVTNGITQLARYASFDVVTNTVGQNHGENNEQLPPGKTTADFLTSILPLDAIAPPPPPNIAAPVITDKGFTKVTPGSFLRFTIEAINDFQKETPKPQVFHATIRVRAGGCANLDERDVIILIPPTNPAPG